MWRLLIISMMLCVEVRAQTYSTITHTEGTKNVGGVDVVVSQIGKPKTGGGLCGIQDYWIGYSANNGYEFTFTKPVNKLRMRLTAVNRHETIRFSVNGEFYPIPEKDVYPFDGSCFGISKSIVIDGNITCREQTSNAEVVIAPNQPISSLTIYHTNGKKKGAGTVFDIAIVDERGISSQGTNGGSTGVNNLSLQQGMFYMLPNPASKIVNLAFLPSSNGTATVTVTDMAGRKVLLQAFDCNRGTASQLQLDVERFVPGNYMVELNLNDEHYVEKLVKL